MNSPKVAPEANIVCEIWDKAPFGPAPLVITLKVPKMKPYIMHFIESTKDTWQSAFSIIVFLRKQIINRRLLVEELTIDMPTSEPVMAPILSFWKVDISSAPWTRGGGAGMVLDGDGSL